MIGSLSARSGGSDRIGLFGWNGISGCKLLLGQVLSNNVFLGEVLLGKASFDKILVDKVFFGKVLSGCARLPKYRVRE